MTHKEGKEGERGTKNRWNTDFQPTNNIRNMVYVNFTLDSLLTDNRNETTQREGVLSLYTP